MHMLSINTQQWSVSYSLICELNEPCPDPILVQTFVLQTTSYICNLSTKYWSAHMRLSAYSRKDIQNLFCTIIC